MNDAIIKTVQEEPARFRYLNNGLTIVCDEATFSRGRGRGGELKLSNPQIVNGQQTSRSLASVPRASADRVEVITRVVQIDREQVDEDEYDRLVSSIVRATNLQSAVPYSDLIANDKMQVELQRTLRRIRALLRSKDGGTRREPGPCWETAHSHSGGPCRGGR